MKKFKPLEIAPWAKAELRARRRAERGEGMRSHVRWIFVILFFSAVLVFVQNHRVGALQIASAQIHHVIDKATLSDRLQKSSLNYEKSINSINDTRQINNRNPSRKIPDRSSGENNGFKSWIKGGMVEFLFAVSAA